MTPLGARVVELERAALRISGSVLEAIVLLLARSGGSAGDDDGLTQEERDHIRETARQLQSAFEAVAHPRHPDQLREVLTSLSFLASHFGDQLIAWTEVMNVLVEEAERHYGTAAGRGAYKRQQVKAAVLTVARREGIELPLVPGFLQPIVFSYAAEIIADFVVAQLNDNELWDFDRLPAQPGWSAWFAGPTLYYGYKTFDAFGGFLTGIAWRIAMGFVRLSPAMQAAVDRVHPELSATVSALGTISRFAAENTDYVRALACIFSIATQEAEKFIGMSGPLKQAYAHDLVLAFLEQNGLVESSGLWREVVSAWLNIMIDATVALFNRRGLFPFQPRDDEAVAERPAGNSFRNHSLP